MMSVPCRTLCSLCFIAILISDSYGSPHLFFHDLPKKSQTLVLQIGESVKISSPISEKAWLSAGNIVSLSDERNSVRIRARRQGYVVLSIGKKIYHLYVLPAKVQKDFRVIQQFLNHREGLHCELSQKDSASKYTLSITGQLLRWKDFKDLSRIAQTHGISYRFSAKIPIELRQAVTQDLQQEWIDSWENKEDHILYSMFTWEQTPLSLRLPATHPYLKRYQEFFKRYGISIRKDSTLTYIQPIIKLKLFLAEGSLHGTINNPFTWPASENLVTQLLTSSYKKWLSLFQRMETQGTAHILAQTVLLSEKGQSVRFHAGGEVPIPHHDPKTGIQTIKWKPYGIQLTFQTKIYHAHRIHISTQMNISEIDHSLSAHLAPSLKKNSLNSSISLKEGQTLNLSTLIRRKGGESHLAHRLISALPLIGSWLSSNGRLKEYTKLNIFITAQQLQQN